MSELALAGVTVLDLTHHIAGPYCTRMLADYGAEVIKVERPGAGDPARHRGPFFHDDPHPDRSGLFLHLNVNKRGITLNLKRAAGRRLLLRLAAEADILVESFAPRVMPSLGLAYDALKEVNPALVMTSISNFGQTGPYRDFRSSEIMAYAMGGPMHATGLPEREPMKLGGDVVQYQAGAAAATATMMGLWAAEETGRGDHLDVSLMRVQASSQDRRTPMLIAYQHTGEVLARRAPGSIPGSGIRPCADGYFHMNTDGPRFGLLAQMIGHPELMEDPRFITDEARAVPGRGEEFDEYLLPWVMERTKAELFEMAQAKRIPSGPVNDVADLLADPNFRERGYWTTIEHPAVGSVAHTGRPFIMNGSPWRVLRPAPRLGEHNREVLGGLLGFSGQELSHLRRDGVI